MVRGQEELQGSQMDFRDANRPQVAARHAPDCEPSWVAYRTEHMSNVLLHDGSYSLVDDRF